MGKYAFGVDVGGTTVKMGLFDKEGSVLDKWEIPTVKDNEGAAVLPDVAESVLAKMSEKGIEKEDVEGVGIGVPGAVNSEGVMVGGAVNIGWGVFNVEKVLNGYLDLPVKAANDANVAAFGEMWQGGGKGYSNMVAVTLGTGVGGGIIIDGKILTGATGAGATGAGAGAGATGAGAGAGATGAGGSWVLPGVTQLLWFKNSSTLIRKVWAGIRRISIALFVRSRS